jgi:peptidoglycan/xylan/chitin deacetylase (PgdA/CDA1 family)
MSLRSLGYPVLFVALVAAGQMAQPALPAVVAHLRAGLASVGSLRVPPSLASPPLAPRAPLPSELSIERPPPVIDPSAMPDPAAWPHLNPDANLRTAWLLAEGPSHPYGDGHRYVTFTFDDGPFPETTPTVLRILERHHVHATFFFLGRYLDGTDDRAARTREVARQVLAAGHLVGNHTEDHRLLTTASPAEVIQQIDDGARAIERTIGRRPVLFRPPYGQLDAEGQAYIAREGLELTLWSIEAHDMLVDDVAEMTRSIEEQISRGGDGIVLLHDIRPATAEVLARVLDWMDERSFRPAHPDQLGYEAVDLPTYLRLLERSPPQSRRDVRSGVTARVQPPAAPRHDEM